jgi:hypothetical protein
MVAGVAWRVARCGRARTPRARAGSSARGRAPARAARRALLPAHVRRDIRDYELLVALLERELGEDSDCLDVGAHAGSVLRAILRVPPRGRHVAWEPLPGFAARLRAEFPGVSRPCQPTLTPGSRPASVATAR